MGGDGLAKGESGKAKRDGNNTRLARVLWGGGATPLQIRQLSDRAGASPLPVVPASPCRLGHRSQMVAGRVQDGRYRWRPSRRICPPPG